MPFSCSCSFLFCVLFIWFYRAHRPRTWALLLQQAVSKTHHLHVATQTCVLRAACLPWIIFCFLLLKCAIKMQRKVHWLRFVFAVWLPQFDIEVPCCDNNFSQPTCILLSSNCKGPATLPVNAYKLNVFILYAYALLFVLNLKFYKKSVSFQSFSRWRF